MKARIRPGLTVWATDPEVREGYVTGCSMRATCKGEITSADEHAVEAWLHGVYYPHVLENEDDD